MAYKRRMKSLIRRAFRKCGYNLYRISTEEKNALDRYEEGLRGTELGDVFGDALSRLTELRSRYAHVDLPIALHSVWGSSEKTDTTVNIGWGGIDLRVFRGHNAYIWSYTTTDPLSARLKYFIYADAVRKADEAGLLNKLQEDGAFGCIRFDYPGLGWVSRDLLDSVRELNFLNKHLRLLDRNDLHVLDIGAGYGRLAYRMLAANPNLSSYTCVDSVPESTFLSEFYLRFRGMDDKVKVIPLDVLVDRLPQNSYDIAINVHSFSECTYSAIEWWLTKLRELRVRHLMIVPNESAFLSTELDRRRISYLPLLSKLGYELITQEPVLGDPAARELIGAEDHLYLFELKS